MSVFSGGWTIFKTPIFLPFVSIHQHPESQSVVSGAIEAGKNKIYLSCLKFSARPAALPGPFLGGLGRMGACRAHENSQTVWSDPF